jgi:glucosamine--fructose-6-phosphate aminotransferase (isomerizing)
MNTYITLHNDDICVIEFNENKIDIIYSNIYDLKKISLFNCEKTPDPYEHWTIKEIYEQPQTILNAINLGGRILNNKNVKLGGCDENIDNLINIDNIILLGCGTSYHSCMYGRHFLTKLCDFNTVNIYDGADFEESDIPKHGNTLIILVSQSGETKDLHRCVDIANKNNIFTMGIINVVDSLISREVNCGIYCNAGREIGVASTKAFTTQIICLSLLACWFSQIKDINENLRIQIIHDLRNLSLDFQNCLNIVHNQINDVIDIINTDNLFILGKNIDECIAREGSLKIKELTYIHSEAYSSSSLKHGPFALLDEKMPVILLNNNLAYESKVLNAYEEILSRNSPIVFITNNKSIKYPNCIYIPNNKSFSSLLGIIPLQLIAYFISIERGINPDKPKNLAKVVTVE